MFHERLAVRLSQEHSDSGLCLKLDPALLPRTADERRESAIIPRVLDSLRSGEARAARDREKFVLLYRIFNTQLHLSVDSVFVQFSLRTCPVVVYI